MKTFNITVSFMLLMVSCQSPSDEGGTTLLNAPVSEVKLSVENETFTVDFRIKPQSCLHFYMGQNILPDVFEKMKTRDDLIDLYKNSLPAFLPGYSSVSPDKTEQKFVKIEYVLSQECFSDRCDSKTRKEVLQLVSNYQKAKYREDINPSCTQKSGVFLMAVILVKEWKHSSKFIDAETLQQALLFLSIDEKIDDFSDIWDFIHYTRNFSNLIIECSEKFLNENKI